MKTQKHRIACLAVTAGDVEITFDPTNEQDVERAAHVINELIEQGYFIAVKQDDGSWKQATFFDARKRTYKFADETEVEATDGRQVTASPPTAAGALPMKPF